MALDRSSAGEVSASGVQSEQPVVVLYPTLDRPLHGSSCEGHRFKNASMKSHRCLCVAFRSNVLGISHRASSSFGGMIRTIALVVIVLFIGFPAAPLEGIDPGRSRRAPCVASERSPHA